MSNEEFHPIGARKGRRTNGGPRTDCSGHRLEFHRPKAGRKADREPHVCARIFRAPLRNGTCEVASGVRWCSLNFDQASIDSMPNIFIAKFGFDLT